MFRTTADAARTIQAGGREPRCRAEFPVKNATLREMWTQQGDGAADPSDAELVARFAVRDEAALGELYDRYSAVANGLALSVLKERALAQETVHDSFLKVWARPTLFDPARGAFSTFILTVVRHAAISRLRAVRYTLPLQDEEGLPLPLADSRVNLLEHSELQQRAERVQAVMQSLKPVQRETVERAFYRGQSREAIAEEMNVPVGTVKSRLKYALDRLRGLLGEDLAPETPRQTLVPGEVN